MVWYGAVSVYTIHIIHLYLIQYFCHLIPLYLQINLNPFHFSLTTATNGETEWGRICLIQTNFSWKALECGGSYDIQLSQKFLNFLTLSLIRPRAFFKDRVQINISTIINTTMGRWSKQNEMVSHKIS